MTPFSGNNARAATSTAKLPAEVYLDALNRLGGIQRSEHSRERLLGYSKLVIAVLTLAAAVFLRAHPMLLASLLAPVAGFVVLAVLQEKLTRLDPLPDAGHFVL